MKLKAPHIISFVYVIITIGFTVYWANNFGEFVKFKGDEFFIFLGFVLGLTYLFLFSLRFTDKKINLFLILLFPLGVAIASFFLGLLFFLISNIAGTPSQTIYIYSGIYTAVTLLLIFYNRKKYIPQIKKSLS
jgi:hypothetical protein